MHDLAVGQIDDPLRGQFIRTIGISVQERAVPLEDDRRATVLGTVFQKLSFPAREQKCRLVIDRLLDYDTMLADLVRSHLIRPKAELAYSIGVEHLVPGDHDRKTRLEETIV